MYFSLALIAYIIDYFFAEFEKIKYLKHPIIYMGNYIKWFENRFYLDNIFRGFILTLSLLCIVFIITFTLTYVDNIFFQGFLCSFAISSNMLYKSVQNVIQSDNPKYAISMLVSRDTKDMNDSDINKAAIETYAENLSDGVIAPLFYMICFGLVGAFIYKAINTLDSMVGYRNKRYEKFGKFSAKLDDVANFLPARITALLIALLFFSKKAFLQFQKYGKKHESLNAGLPISAMALAINIKLGGPTSYFGRVKQKPYFGDGKKEIKKEDVKKALSIKPKLDIFIITILSILTISFY
ncbi:adenosylcobinamide-phosphate synthase CbiB [Halarcobacter sp.]|uniref:adenosylcobinamide-phosphate synthase CbiB n=1 Tax=Halarcobacter sp. TaxID=2321133 RepID=UPI002AAB3174|nr:adenosylcobinamide-phosphate synthase CbiB [Halarcobacter sp.]